ncbi:HEPN domain-containing protein [Cellulomonas septica]|uniref:Apea-like HEPN domain-containing protein n=1 Tax=Cellulomonas septica TaxID=285080 RepID=A0ABX1JX42_9CELL|nr:HEPN domain-containing protein [Cellulomonas septica]NKY38612.1 hypothetical protein [Cellulomonas septica]
MAIYPELRLAIDAWRAEALPLIASYDGRPIAVVQDPWRVIEQSEQTATISRASRPPAVRMPPELMAEFGRLATWAKVREEIAKVVDLTGANLAGVDDRELNAAAKLLPPPGADVEGSLDEVFEEFYEQFEEFLAEPRPQLSIWVLPTSPAAAIDLEDGIQFDRLEPTELAVALNLGVVRVGSASRIVVSDFQWTFGCIRHSHRTLFDFDEDATLIPIDEAIDAVLALTSPRPIATLGTFSVAKDWLFGGMGRSYQQAVRETSSHTVSTVSGERVAKVWRLVRSPALPRPIRLALRRLRHSPMRTHPEDELLDLMIAAEALYLGGAEQGELSHQLSLRAALWAPEDGIVGRRETRALMKKAYSLRSQIAHGRAVDLEKQFEVFRNRYDYWEIVWLVRQVLSVACEKALRAPAWPPDWEAMLFPDAATDP